MPVSTTIQVVGVKDTINALRKIDPQLQKDFKAQATQIAEPAIDGSRDKIEKEMTQLIKDVTKTVQRGF